MGRTYGEIAGESRRSPTRRSVVLQPGRRDAGGYRSYAGMFISSIAQAGRFAGFVPRQADRSRHTHDRLLTRRHPARDRVSVPAKEGSLGPVSIWETATGRRLATFPGRPEELGNLVFTPDGRSLLICEPVGRSSVAAGAGRRRQGPAAGRPQG